MTRLVLLGAITFLLFPPLQSSAAPDEADVLTLKNGDRLTGQLLGFVDGMVLFKSDTLGEIHVPRDQATLATEAPAAKLSAPAVPDQSAAATLGKKPNKKKGKDAWKKNMGFSFSDKGGPVDSSEYSVKAQMAYDGKKNDVKWDAYYKYYKQDGEKGEDNYGASQNYRHQWRDGLFLQSETRYDVDKVKRNRTKASQVAGVGYAPWKSEKFKVDVAPGLKAEHVKNAENDDINGTTYKLSAKQNMAWKINDDLRLKQELNYSVDPKNS
ncbi:MAG: DUF481 domain-containing protein, partial [Verrucomicrobiota bacterium]